jgi:hypothetical protein
MEAASLPSDRLRLLAGLLHGRGHGLSKAFPGISLKLAPQDIMGRRQARAMANHLEQKLEKLSRLNRRADNHAPQGEIISNEGSIAPSLVDVAHRSRAALRFPG